MSTMVNRTKRTDKVIEIILKNLREGMTRDIACTQAGINRKTLHRWCESDEALSADVAAAIDVSKALLINEVRDYLLRADACTHTLRKH